MEHSRAWSERPRGATAAAPVSVDGGARGRGAGALILSLITLPMPCARLSCLALPVRASGLCVARST